jgi:rubredoxin
LAEPYKTWQCGTCGFIYDEAAGLPAEGLPPGTRWDEIPESWCCPDCGMSKAQFDMVELTD